MTDDQRPISFNTSITAHAKLAFVYTFVFNYPIVNPNIPFAVFVIHLSFTFRQLFKRLNILANFAGDNQILH